MRQRWLVSSLWYHASTKHSNHPSMRLDARWQQTIKQTKQNSPDGLELNKTNETDKNLRRKQPGCKPADRKKLCVVSLDFILFFKLNFLMLPLDACSQPAGKKQSLIPLIILSNLSKISNGKKVEYNNISSQCDNKE